MRPLERVKEGLLAVRDSRAAGRVAELAADLARATLALVVEALRIAREMLVIPAQLWLAAAEVAGRVVLRAWGFLLPVLAAAAMLAGSALRLAQRQVTPARALTIVSIGALVALAASQWTDYRGIGVGTTDYAGGVESVAPAPEVDRRPTGDAHGWVMLPLAAAGVAVLALALAGRRRLAALLLPLGIAVLAVGVVVDAPKGLDEGGTGIAYEGAQARLLEGFWAQLAAGAVIAACGALLPSRLRPDSSPTPLRRQAARGTRRPTLQELSPPSPASSHRADPPIQGTTS